MYAIGQKFEGMYPPEAAQWCNANGAIIVQIEEGFEIQVPPAPTLEDQLAAIEAEHAAGEDLLNKRILGVTLAGGQTQAAKIAALQAAYTALASETDAKLRALLPATEGE